MCISGAFSNSYRPNPSPHPTNNVGRVYPEFFSEFQLCTGWGKEELQENFERVHSFMREIKLCNEKLSLAIAPVNGRERSRESLFSWASSLGLGSAVGKKSKRPRGPPPFLLPGLPLGSLCSPIFFPTNADFFSFFPQYGAWSQASKRAALIMTAFFNFWGGRLRELWLCY